MTEWDPVTKTRETADDIELKPVIELITRSPPPSHNDLVAFDETTRAYYGQRERLKIENGVLYRLYHSSDGNSDHWQIIPPQKYRKEILETVHAGFGRGHFGLKKTKLKLQNKAYWVGWSSDVTNFIKACEPCARYFKGTPPRTGPLQSYP